jgi:pimeloyl-ACP methyl ester carboxylesterase
MVAYAMTRQFPEILRGAMILDAPLPGIAGWDEVQSDPLLWHVKFMQAPDLPEKLIVGRQAEFFDYFFAFSKFSKAEKAHYAQAYPRLAQLHAVFEIYRAFPANEKFNAAQRDANDVPTFIAFGEKSPFVRLMSNIAGGLRANGMSKVETGTIPGAVHYVVQDNPQGTADLIEAQASRNLR